ncbi:MAG: hypothetical protein ACRDDH_14490 [Cetobacterium sp.]
MNKRIVESYIITKDGKINIGKDVQETYEKVLETLRTLENK